MQTEGFFKDTAAAIGDTDCVTGGNLGLFYRYHLTRDGGVIELLGGLSLDLMNEDQQRLLINGVQFGIKLWPNKREFCLMSAEDNANYKIDIVDAKLKLKHVKLSPGAIIGHQEAISSSDALYPFYRSDIKTFNIPSGQYSFSADDLYLGCVPSCLIVTLTSAAGYNGSFLKKPFNFANFGCCYISFLIDG